MRHKQVINKAVSTYWKKLRTVVLFGSFSLCPPGVFEYEAAFQNESEVKWWIKWIANEFINKAKGWDKYRSANYCNNQRCIHKQSQKTRQYKSTHSEIITKGFATTYLIF
jgi:hypothetical protein